MLPAAINVHKKWRGDFKVKMFSANLVGQSEAVSTRHSLHER